MPPGELVCIAGARSRRPHRPAGTWWILGVLLYVPTVSACSAAVPASVPSGVQMPDAEAKRDDSLREYFDEITRGVPERPIPKERSSTTVSDNELDGGPRWIRTSVVEPDSGPRLFREPLRRAPREWIQGHAGGRALRRPGVAGARLYLQGDAAARGAGGERTQGALRATPGALWRFVLERRAASLERWAAASHAAGPRVRSPHGGTVSGLPLVRRPILHAPGATPTARLNARENAASLS